MLREPFYDPEKSYEENYEKGPFGDFAAPDKFQNKGEPQFDFLGNKVYLPFGIPAGPLLNGKFVKAALDSGFDIAVYKTVRTGDYPCHPHPNVVAVDFEGDLSIEKASEGLTSKENYGEPLSITNSFGVPSTIPEIWQKDLAEATRYAGKGQVVVGSFQGTKKGDGNVDAFVADFVLGARLVKETGTKILEVNFSCPNEGTAHLLCFDIPMVRKVSEAIKNEIGNTPLVIKIAYYEDQEALKKLISEVGNIVDGISAINTIGSAVRNKNGEQALPGEGRLVSGVCGQAIKWAGLDMTKRLKDLREGFGLKYAIVGVGGVSSADDFKKYREAGADAVMSATGAMWNPMLAQEIKKIDKS
ncbi:MAG: diguanylate cyclase, partial [Candidatus Moranbacteria bacterium]|nr:diguanylate cyclase [Candidatus Moranbacteria bacterium]